MAPYPKAFYLQCLLLTLSLTILRVHSFGVTRNRRQELLDSQIGLSPNYSPPPPLPHCCPVDTSKLWRRSLNFLSPAVRPLVAQYYDYSYLTPQRELTTTLTHYGAAVRLRNFVTNLISGTRPLKIGVLGGSWSIGCCSENFTTHSWYPLVGQWLQSVAKAGIISRNGAVSATPSFFMVYCVLDHVDIDVDLVFIEFTPNDGTPDKVVDCKVVMDMEKLIRRLLVLPRKPAVVMVENPRVLPTGLQDVPHTSEYSQGVHGPYYDVPIVSPHTALRQLTYTYPTPGFDYGHLYTSKHPGNAGHKVICDAVVNLFQTAVTDLVQRPFGQADLDALAAPLPEPMHKDNWPPVAATCTIGAALPELATKVRGFDLVNEGKPNNPKIGFVSTVPGSTLEFTLDTYREELLPPERVSISLVYLSSYTHMGRASMECVRGCLCESVKVDSYSRFGESQSYMSTVLATQHSACVIRITVLNETSSDGYKFKVNGIVVAELGTDTCLD